MQLISDVEFGSVLDFDHGEGWVAFSWHDSIGIARSLTIDFDGHCSREMPVRSGTGVEIVAVERDRVCLRFADQLATKLELDQEIEFTGTIPDDVWTDLRRLAELH